MRFPRVGFLFAAAMSVATSAFGAAGVITPQVTPLTSPVTYSTNASPPLETFVAFLLNGTNTGVNTVNDVLFTFVATATDPAETVALFNPSVYLPAGCAQTGVNSFACTKSQLQAGESFFSQPIVVFFRAPVKVVNGVADTQGTDFVNVGGNLTYAEGTSGKNPRPNSSVTWTGPQVSLGTTDPVNVRSALPQEGGSFFTGNGATTTVADQFAVKVTVPAAPTFSTAELFESDVTSNINCTSLGNFIRCPAVEVTIPDIVFTAASGSFMTFLLRVDASNRTPSAKISNVLIQYSNNAVDPPVFVPTVQFCLKDGSGNPLPNLDKTPCIAKAVHYKNKSVQGWTPELNDDYEFTAIGLGNGSFNMF